MSTQIEPVGAAPAEAASPKIAPSEAASSAAATRAEVCVAACADLYARDGEIIISAFGTIPAIGARLARELYAPDLLISDGAANMMRGNPALGDNPDAVIEAWTPFRTVFDLLWHGKRHVTMVPSQIDAHGNSNISAIGDFHRPAVALLGARGAPGNSISHATSYWVPRHSPRVFVGQVDTVSGVGTDRAAAAGGSATRFQDLRPVVTDLAVLAYGSDGRLRLASVHPGVEVDEVRAATGFDLGGDDEVPTTRIPTAAELRLIREVIDPHGLREKEVAS